MQGNFNSFSFSKADRKYIIEDRNLFWINHGAEINDAHPLSSIDKKVKDLLGIDENNLEEDVFSLLSLLSKCNLFIAVGAAHFKSNGNGLIELLRKQGYNVTAVDLLNPQKESEQINSFSF